jgi:AhpD family alkylhydroperoxidase
VKNPTLNEEAEGIRKAVRAGYGQIAKTGGSCCGATPTCGNPTPAGSEALAKLVGYSAEELAALPEGANMGLSCGNPNVLAALRPGEVVLDLGSGGGFDAFIAARKVGATGRALGVDMTPEMLAKARNNIGPYRKRSGLDNVEFRLGEIEHLPIADNSVDVVISNCVINLSPDKPQVWREIARVLKPGGRVAVSDLALLKPLPAEILKMVEALVGCVAGAVRVSETERMAREAGLTEIRLNPKKDYLAAMTDWNDPLYKKIIEHLPAGSGPADYITSLEVTASKAPSAVAYSPAVDELVAMGAAIAANCQPCLKYHYRQADQLGVSKADMARAVATGARVKDSPHQAILRLADKLTGAGLSQPADAADRCSGSKETLESAGKSKCCG